MNVAFDPWIPIVTTSGQRKLVSLCAVFTEGEKFVDLAVRPHERVALMRLFLCVAHASLNGPEDYDEWLDAPGLLPKAAQVYLTQWKDSFELFHETKPWLQVAKLKQIPSESSKKSGNKKVWSPLSKLCFTRASGNNSTIFDHEANSRLLSQYSTEEVTLNLLTFQNFFVAGGKASSRLWGNITMKNPPNPKGGPCSGKSLLFTFLRDKNLNRSIHMNLNTYENLKLIYDVADDGLGKPLWEMPIKSPSDFESVTNATKTHIGRLVPQTRILKINKDCKRVLLGAGFLYPKFQDESNPFTPDLFATTVINKKGKRMLLSARPNIAIWRNLHSLIVRKKSASSSNRGPTCLLNVTDTDSCDIIVNAMMTNPEQAAEIVDLLESVFHIPSQLHMPEGSASYEYEVKEAEYHANNLGWAVETYRKEVDPGWEGRLKSAGSSKGKLKANLHSVATIHYWTEVERNLPLLMAHIESIGTETAIPKRDAWRTMLRSSAQDAYRVACGHETPRQMRAFTRGLQKLNGRKNELVSKNKGSNKEARA